MNSKSVSDTYKEQTDELYKAIGKFTVKFEHISNALRVGIIFYLHKSGLRNQRIAEVMLSDITAEPLKNIFQALIPEFITLDQQDNQIVKKLFKKVVNIIEQRNDVIHRTWYVGWASAEQTDFSKVHGEKFKKSKKGLEFRPLEYKVEDFDALSEECDFVAMLINRLAICAQHGYKISKDVELSKLI